MKRIILSFLLTGFFCLPLAAQEVNWLEKYQKQVAAVGLAGPGVDAVLNRWAKADSSDANFIRASYVYYFAKSHSLEVVANTSAHYLGREPVFSLPDTSRKVTTYYYQIDRYAEEPFGRAMTYLDKMIASDRNALELRVEKISDLILYEGESPDMALTQLLSLVDEDRGGKRSWTYEGAPQDRAFFDGVIQEFCANLFQLGTPQARSAFLSLSEKMLSYDKNAVPFISNQGSYYMSIKEYKKALKYFDKAIKLEPDAYNAVKNATSIALVLKDVKLQKKYLPMLVRCGSDSEKLSAQARLDSLN